MKIDLNNSVGSFSDATTADNIKEPKQRKSKEDLVIFLSLLSCSFEVTFMGLSSIAARTGLVLYLVLIVIAAVVNYSSFKAFLFLTHHYKLKNFISLYKFLMGKWDFLAFLFLFMSNIAGLVGNMMILIKYWNELLINSGLHEA